jgi:hypothetical protein
MPEQVQDDEVRGWLHTQQGLDWLQSSNGREWLQSSSGREWMQTQGQEWLKSHAGRDWLQVSIGQAQQLTTGTSILLPMDPPKLHWQLLPYDPTRSKRFIHFDISFPTDDIQYRQNSSHGIQHIPLPDADLDKPAADKTLTQMTIQFQHNPFKWDIDVTRNEGIRVHDVFEAIYAAFQEPLTSYEKDLIPYYRYAGYEEAFELRCKLTAENPVVDQRQVWKRVDALLHKTFFLGLAQSKLGGDWRLNVGGTMLTSNQGSIRRGGRDLSSDVPIVRHHPLADIS